MKRARYVTGAAVLAPVAMGMALPAAAQASTSHGTAAARGKSVSLEPVQARVTPDSCTGTNPFTIGRTPNSHLRGHGWTTRYNPGSVCVGTVDYSAYFTKNICKSTWVKVKTPAATLFTEGTYLCGTTGHWKSTTDAIHRVFNSSPGVVSLRICIGSQYGKSNCVHV